MFMRVSRILLETRLDSQPSPPLPKIRESRLCGIKTPADAVASVIDRFFCIFWSHF